MENVYPVIEMSGTYWFWDCQLLELRELGNRLNTKKLAELAAYERAELVENAGLLVLELQDLIDEVDELDQLAEACEEQASWDAKSKCSHKRTRYEGEVPCTGRRTCLDCGADVPTYMEHKPTQTGGGK
jgi:hypothetical protein